MLMSLSSVIAAAASSLTVEFTSTQEYIVPDGVSSIEMHLWGGGGNGCTGGYTVGRINVSSGTKLFIIVGGHSGNKTYVNGWGYYGSGGLSGVFDVSDGSTDYSISNLATRVIAIAGGGGGSNGNANGGNGGGLTGSNGGVVGWSSNRFYAGTGGTQTAGGIGGAYYTPTDNTRKSAPNGGRFECGRANDGYYNLRGNGGGGWWAGGGCGAIVSPGRGSTGGGGGSGYVNTSGTFPVYNGSTTGFNNQSSYYKNSYGTSKNQGFVVLITNPSP